MLPSPRLLFHLALGTWIAILLGSWLCAGPLGHDEAAYAIGGARLAAHLPSPWLYRSVGMHVLALPGVLLGGSELALRLPALPLAILYLFALRRVGRLVSERAGAWAAAVAVGMHGLSLRGHELLSDLPSATCVLLGLAVLGEELEREGGSRPRVALAAPWLAAGFYLRYASVVPIALVLLFATLVWRRSLRARPWPLVGFAALLALLLAPHVAQAMATVGSPLGIIRYSSGVPRRDYLGDGLVGYLFGNPFLAYGVIATPVLLAGLMSVLGPPAPGQGRRAARVLWLVAVTQIVILGLVSHAQPRYIYVALSLLVVLGVDLVARKAHERGVGPAWQKAGHAAVALAALGVLVGAPLAARHSHAWLTPIAEAGRIVRRDAAGRRCHVVSRRFTQLMWYSGCESANYGPRPEELVRFPLVYGVTFAGTPATARPEDFRLPSGVALSAAPVEERPGRFEILRMTPPAAP